VWVVIGLLIAAKIGGLPLLYVLLVGWALRGHRCALQALTFSFFLAYLNPAFFPDLGLAGLLRWVVFGAAVARILFDARYLRIPMPYTTWALAAFCVIIAASSSMMSLTPTVSLLKLLLFGLGAAAITAAVQLNRGMAAYWKSWFFTLLLVVLCLSIPTYFVHDIGFHRNGRGFQGILNHPQAFAVFLCPMTAWLTSVYLTREETSPLFGFSLLLAWFSLFASQARTGFIAIALSVIVALVLMSIFQLRALRNTFLAVMRDKRAFTAMALSLIAALSFAIVNSSNIQEGLEVFLAKGTKMSSAREGFEKSRGTAIEKSWKNFQENPLFGIGFGTISDPEDDKGLGTSVGGITVSAPVEKGFLPAATLEENGLVGTFFLVVFMGLLLQSCLRKKSFSGLCIFLTCIFVNFGEMVFFSMGGIGLYVWLVLGLSLMSDSANPDFASRSVLSR
jgi:hypothetical protein